MFPEILVRAPVGLLPVLLFLGFLLWIDSYKLVTLRDTLLVIAGGALVAAIAYLINSDLVTRSGMAFYDYARFGAPVIEECLKGLIVVLLFRTHRIGFLVDAAIFGFAVGAGFAFAENLFYLTTEDHRHLAVWVVRGFGTAIMHGSATAIFAIFAQVLTERNMRINPLLYLPGLLVAVALHSLFNHFPLHPIMMTLAVMLLAPPLLAYVFKRSADKIHDWLELDFDADALLLEQLNSRVFAQTRVGQFLHDLRSAFEGPVVVDMLCYLRLHTELAMRAKGALLMREEGFEVAVGERTRAKFAELAYLERSIGKTGMLAMRPFLRIERKALWQMHVIDRK
ncbi:MAG: PrsW family intramembrane metalloprotease [Xanthomonadales bacterium]|nr:PrsW family intramembrane metalloprotease [Xanthomonadales bacterium]